VGKSAIEPFVESKVRPGQDATDRGGSASTALDVVARLPPAAAPDRVASVLHGAAAHASKSVENPGIGCHALVGGNPGLRTVGP
jgi:hypothetical protein